MFKLKVFTSILIFSSLLIITSTIKNQTREIEKKIYKMNNKIHLKEKDLNESQLDFYYLTKPEKYILMCCKFSSYSITASILGNKELFVFKNSLKSNLPRYKAKIHLIDG